MQIFVMGFATVESSSPVYNLVIHSGVYATVVVVATDGAGYNELRNNGVQRAVMVGIWEAAEGDMIRKLELSALFGVRLLAYGTGSGSTTCFCMFYYCVINKSGRRGKKVKESGYGNGVTCPVSENFHSSSACCASCLH